MLVEEYSYSRCGDEYVETLLESLLCSSPVKPDINLAAIHAPIHEFVCPLPALARVKKAGSTPSDSAGSLIRGAAMAGRQVLDL